MDDGGRDDWVSVIIPTYNRADLLQNALNSVRKQTYRPVELIVVDDGSTDATASMVERWKSDQQGDDFQVEYVRQENAGPSAARNRGLVCSTGEYIQFLDSDDQLHPKKLSVHIQALEDAPPCDVVIGDHVLFNPDEEVPNFEKWDKVSLLREASYHTVDTLSLLAGNLWDGLYRRALLVQAGPINEDLRWMEDVEYNIRVSAVTTSVRTVDVPLLAFSRHGGNHLTGVRNRPEGFEVGFAAVKAMEDTVDAIEDGKETSVRHTIGNFYMGLAHLALRFRQSDNFETAIRSALRNRTGLSFRVKARLLKAFRRLAGDEMTHRLWSRIGQFDTTQKEK